VAVTGTTRTTAFFSMPAAGAGSRRLGCCEGGIGSAAQHGLFLLALGIRYLCVYAFDLIFQPLCLLGLNGRAGRGGIGFLQLLIQAQAFFLQGTDVGRTPRSTSADSATCTGSRWSLGRDSGRRPRRCINAHGCLSANRDDKSKILHARCKNMCLRLRRCGRAWCRPLRVLSLLLHRLAVGSQLQAQNAQCQQKGDRIGNNDGPIVCH